ncbi:MAG: hypothetical protein DIU78_003790 [Pseudomonadota bacterium]
MPAPLGPLIGLALGGLLARARPDGPGRERLSLGALLLVVLFALLVFAPAAAYFMVFEPDWAYAYLIDGSHRIGALNVALILANVVSVPAGFALSLRAPPTRELATLSRVVGLPALGVGLFVVVLFPRLSVQATYAQFHGDFGTRPVAGGPLGYALIWTTLVIVGGAAWTAYALRRMA